MAWFGERSPSDEARAAHDAAEESRQQALSDLASADEKLQESLPIIEAIRSHNERNHYDEFLRQLTTRAFVGE